VPTGAATNKANVKVSNYMSNNNNPFNESLSALMDNEIDEFEVRRILKASNENPDILQSWNRYHLAATAMRRELPPRIADLSARISVALENEAPHSRGFSQFLRPLGRVAIAASVTAAAVFGLQQIQYSGFGPGQLNGIADSRPVQDDNEGPIYQLPAGYELPTVSARTVSTSPTPDRNTDHRPVLVVKKLVPDLETQEEIQSYLNEAMFRHTENAARRSSHGGMLYARLPVQEQESP